MPVFHESWRQFDNYTYHIEKGGRDTGKSTMFAQRMVYNRMKYKTSGLCIRRYANTLRDSMFQDLLWAIRQFGVEYAWIWRVSPLKLIYTPTGASILFRGADDVDRIKGIKTKYPIADCWIDELAEFKHEEDLDIIIDSVLRNEISDRYHFMYSYNPPKRKGNWCNKKFNTKQEIPDTRVHHTNVYDNIYASQQIIERANQMKKDNKQKWRWMYMGDPIGGGVVPFDNLVFRDITFDEYKSFDRIRAGVDWGYANNIFAYIRVHFDKTRRKLYFLDEIGGLKMKNRDTARKIKINRWYERIIADSASPKDIDEFRLDYGIDMVKAKKGPGSVESGERWLDSLEEIVIDWGRTPLAAKQFEDIDYAVDAHGNILPKLEDKENDFIDATRYAVEEEIRAKAKLY